MDYGFDTPGPTRYDAAHTQVSRYVHGYIRSLLSTRDSPTSDARMNMMSPHQQMLRERNIIVPWCIDLKTSKVGRTVEILSYGAPHFLLQ